ncbi:unnamed protein product [Closterium sp. NIES-54]
MDVWGPARVSGRGRERYFLLVADNYTRYTTVFLLRNKGQVVDVLIPWICAVRLQLRKRFRHDFPILFLHSDRGGEFSSDLLHDFCHGEGILQSFTLPASPQQNGVAERRIGLVMELNLWPCVSLPETSPTLRWTGKVGDASVFRVWGSRAFVRDTSANKLSSCAISYVFLGFAPDAPGWQFYHPTLRRGPAPSGVSQVDPLPLAESVKVTVDSGAARGGAARGAVSRGAEPAGAEPAGAVPGVLEPGGAKTEGAEPGGAESEGAESGGAEPRGIASAGGPAGASPRQSRRRKPLSPRQLRKWFSRRTRLRSGAEGAGGPAAGGAGATSPEGAGVTAGAGGIGGVGAAGPGGARTRGTRAAGSGGVGGDGVGDPGAGGNGSGGAGAGGTGAGDLGAGGAGAGGVGAGGTGAGGAGAGGAGAGGTGAGGAGARDPGAEGAGAGGAGAGGTGAGGTVQRRPFFVPPLPSSLPPRGSVLREVLSLPSSTDLTPRLLCPPPHQSQPQLQPDSPLPAPSPNAEQTDSLTEHREPESCPTSPVCAVCAVRTVRHVPRPCPPPVSGTHIMALRPSSVPLRVPLPSPPASSLADGPDPESDLVRAASPTVTRLLANVITNRLFESTAAFALVSELVDFAAAVVLTTLPLSLPPPGSVLRQPDSPLHAPSPYAEQTESLTERHEPVSRPALPVRALRTGCHVPRPRTPPVLGTYIMELCPSSVSRRVTLPSPPASSLADGPDPEFDLVRTATPTVTCLLATIVTDPSFKSADASALVAELVEFVAACRLDYATSLVAKSESDCPPSVGVECALGTDVLDEKQEDFECLAAYVPHLVAMLLAPEGDPDAPDILNPRSYAEAITGIPWLQR